MKQKSKAIRKFLGDMSKMTLAGVAMPLTLAEGKPHGKSMDFGFSCGPYLQNVTGISAHIFLITNRVLHVC